MSQKTEVYRMPPVDIGEPILFYADGDPLGQVRPAFVTAIGQGAVCLAYFEKDAVNIEPRDGVRHVSDPVLNKPEARASGVWDYAPFGREVRRLSTKVDELCKLARLDLSRPKE